MKNFILIAVIFLTQMGTKVNAQRNSIDNLDISKMIQPVASENMFLDSAYNIWCGSPIAGKNGKYYLFYSRWPRNTGHEGWITNSEIALATADKPGGPYQHQKVVLKARGKSYWDGSVTHNPYIIAYKNKYYLFYIGTVGEGVKNVRSSSSNPVWWHYRNGQRIGVAVADNLDGEFKRLDEPIFSVNPDTTAFDAVIVSNPAVTITPKGRVALMYKGVEKNGKLHGGVVKMGIAFADNVFGPYERVKKPILELPNRGKSWMLAEDPFLWYQNNKYYTIIRDVAGKFTGDLGALAMLSSPNGIDWTPTSHTLVAPSKIKFANGKMGDDRLERPFLFFDKKGMPIYLFGAMGIKGRAHSMNIAVPLKQK